MNTKSFIIMLSLFLLGVTGMKGQSTDGYIISIENGIVYVDLTNAQVEEGDRLEVVVRGGYMTHPETGRRIRKEDVVLSKLEVETTHAEYSVARPIDPSVLPQLKQKMIVRKAKQIEMRHSDTQEEPLPQTNNNGMPLNKNVNDDRASIVISPAQVNDVVNSGHFGGYVADILMEQMLMCDKVRLLDRSVLNAQMDEINLAGDLLDPSTTIQRGKAIGARYVLQTTMQKPDVANVKTGIPLASVMGAVQGFSGVNIGARYASNAQIGTLKAAVSISVRVVDLQTSEVVFMCSGSGNAKGKSQLSLEYGALGGGQLNGGAQDFKQTVTGQAILKAFSQITPNLKAFFNGDTDKKFMGGLSGGFSNGEKMYAKGYKLYLGTQKLGKDDVAIELREYPDLYFQYQKARKKRKNGRVLGSVGILLLCGGGATAGIGVGNQYFVPTIAGAAAGVVGLCCCISWPAKHNAGKRIMNQVANSYNLKNSGQSYTHHHNSYKYDLSFTPTGICFTF